MRGLFIPHKKKPKNCDDCFAHSLYWDGANWVSWCRISDRRQDVELYADHESPKCPLQVRNIKPKEGLEP